MQASIMFLYNRLKSILNEYCKRTTLRGFQFITNRSSQKFFLLVSCSCLILCVYLISLQILGTSHRITTKTASTSHPIQKVTFPSVTICNFNVVYKNNIKKVTDIVRHHGFKEKDLYSFFSNLSALITYDELNSLTSYQQIYDALSLHEYDANRLMQELAQPCSSMLKTCIWQIKEVACQEIFNFVKTSQGYCCSFNYRGPESKMRNGNDELYVKGAGPTFSLRVLLNVEESQYTSPVKPSYGFKVLVQDSIHYPDMELTAYTVLRKEEATISVTPSVYASVEDIKQNTVRDRCCLFDNEGDLQWTSKYSYITCLSECKAKAIFELCQCIPFYYPNSKNTRICTFSDVPCLRHNRFNYSALSIPSCYVNGKELQANQALQNDFHCGNCYPQCDETMYTVHIDKTRDTQMEGFEYSNSSILNVYFNTNGCIKIERELYITWNHRLEVGVDNVKIKEAYCNKMPYKVKSLQSKQAILSRIGKQIKDGILWYCDRTSLHGFCYISCKSSSVFTRVFFASASCCSIILCIYLIILQLHYYKERSITTTITSTDYPVGKVRFPSVTLCNLNVVYKDNVKHLMNAATSRGIKGELFTNFTRDLSSLIIHDNIENMSAYRQIINMLHDLEYNPDRLMAELAQPCNSMIKKCFWQAEEVPCLKIIQTTKTTEGYCCAFNHYGTNKSLGNIPIEESHYYQYTSGAGPSLGLKLYLDVEPEQYVSSIKQTYGINILVQDGIDFPDMSLIANIIGTAEELLISVTPRLYVSSKDIRDVHPEIRHCLFEDEGDLEWTPVYGYKTCISECIAKAIFEYCKCIPFYYPVQNYTPSCSLLDVPCLQLNKYKYSALDFEDDFGFDQLHGDVDDDETFDCHCHPQCNERMFDLHVNRAEATHMDGYEDTNMSVLNVYYSTDGCIRTERDVYYTWDRALASIGGIFALCLGGSIISIIECVYFLCKCLTNFTKNKFNEELRNKNHLKIYLTDFKSFYQKKKPYIRQVDPKASIVVRSFNKY